jgi:hypothetical protein
VPMAAEPFLLVLTLLERRHIEPLELFEGPTLEVRYQQIARSVGARQAFASRKSSPTDKSENQMSTKKQPREALSFSSMLRLRNPAMRSTCISSRRR